MNESDLKNFATYSLDQESRGIAHDINQRQNHISKFGVGAKEAGFFLGDRIRVISKIATEENIYEMCMDEKEYETRYRQGEAVYNGQIHRITKAIDLLKTTSETQTILSMDELKNLELVKYINTHCQSNNHYTIIIIHLRSSEVSKFEFRHNNIFEELSLIYHFYLFPEHNPNIVINEQKYQKPNG